MLSYGKAGVRDGGRVGGGVMVGVGDTVGVNDGFGVNDGRKVGVTVEVEVMDGSTSDEVIISVWSGAISTNVACGRVRIQIAATITMTKIAPKIPNRINC